MGEGKSTMRRIGAIAGSIMLMVLTLACTAEPPEATAHPHNKGGSYELNFSASDQAYIDAAPVLEVAVFDGAAPLLYLDAQKSPRGISIRVFEEISARSGLSFTYVPYENAAAIWKSEADIIPILDAKYLLRDIPISIPYIQSEAVLFMRKGIDVDQLSNKRFAMIDGGTPPEEIAEELVVRFDSRELAIEGVDRGLADYGYGNVYSLSFLLLKKNFQNIVIVPRGIEPRIYRVGILSEDERLLSIINQTLDSISKGFLQTIIFEEASQIPRELSFSIVMSRYGTLLVSISLLVTVVLLILGATILRSRKLLHYQNQRYELLFDMSEGYLFEFSEYNQRLSLSPQSQSKLAQLRLSKQELVERLQERITRNADGLINEVVVLELRDGSQVTYRLQVMKQEGITMKTEPWIGMLSDISAEEKEKAELRNWAETDGLTGLLNQFAVYRQVSELLRTYSSERFDVFLLLDCDSFKHINDTYGHLEGNRHLQGLGDSLIAVFKDAAVMGRVGGDEFGVYLRDVTSLDDAIALSEEVNPAYQKRTDSIFTVSIGLTKVEEGDTYETLFDRADIALYASKHSGGNRITVG